MAFNYTLLANYLLCFGFGFMLLFIFMHGYLTSWLKVKLPFFKNADIQVRIKNPIGDYYCTGSYNKGNLYYRAKPRPDNSKPDRMLQINQDVYNLAVYRANGVPCIDVDDVKNCILVWQGGTKNFENAQDYQAVVGFNAESVDATVKRAMKRPDPNQQGMNQKLFQLIVIGAFLIIGVAIYFIFKKFGLIDSHIKMVYDLVRPMYMEMNLTNVPISTLPTG